MGGGETAPQVLTAIQPSSRRSGGAPQRRTWPLRAVHEGKRGARHARAPPGTAPTRGAHVDSPALPVGLVSPKRLGGPTRIYTRHCLDEPARSGEGTFGRQAGE